MAELAVTAEDVIDQPAQIQFETFLNEQRAMLQDCLDGLTEEQARRSLVPSDTTFDPDALVHGNGRGPLSVRWVCLHLLRELAQHCGHADILREQILSSDH